MSDDAADPDDEQACAIAVLLAQVPATPAVPPGSTQWVESDRSKVEPYELY